MVLTICLFVCLFVCSFVCRLGEAAETIGVPCFPREKPYREIYARGKGLRTTFARFRCGLSICCRLPTLQEIKAMEFGLRLDDDKSTTKLKTWEFGHYYFRRDLAVT